jgi:hypothetical protein
MAWYRASGLQSGILSWLCVTLIWICWSIMAWYKTSGLQSGILSDYVLPWYGYVGPSWLDTEPLGYRVVTSPYYVLPWCEYVGPSWPDTEPLGYRVVTSPYYVLPWYEYVYPSWPDTEPLGYRVVTSPYYVLPWYEYVDPSWPDTEPLGCRVVTSPCELTAVGPGESPAPTVWAQPVCYFVQGYLIFVLRLGWEVLQTQNLVQNLSDEPIGHS